MVLGILCQDPWTKTEYAYCIIPHGLKVKDLYSFMYQDAALNKTEKITTESSGSSKRILSSLSSPFLSHSHPGSTSHQLY